MEKLLAALLVLLILIGPGLLGIYLTFKASIILGIVAIIIQPSPTIFGWLAIFGMSDIPQKIANWLNLPF